MFAKISIDSLTNNIVESLKFILIGQSIDNRIYEINPHNAYFGDLNSGVDKRFITIHQIYRINDDIIFMLNNGSIVNE